MWTLVVIFGPLSGARQSRRSTWLLNTQWRIRLQTTLAVFRQPLFLQSLSSSEYWLTWVCNVLLFFEDISSDCVNFARLNYILYFDRRYHECRIHPVSDLAKEFERKRRSSPRVYRLRNCFCLWWSTHPKIVRVVICSVRTTQPATCTYS